MYSLRRTLVVRFSLTLFGALVFIAVWAFVGAQRLLREELDRGLQAAAGLELTFLRAGFPLHPYPDRLSFPEFVEELNRFVVVRTFPGTIAAGNTEIALELPVEREAYERAVAGAQVWTTQTWDEHRVRSLYMPVASGPGPPDVIQVAASLIPLERAGRELLLLMLGTAVLGVVATAIGAYWLAGSSMAPVTAIADQAAAINAGSTGKRISAHADVVELRALIDVLNGMLDRLDRAFISQRRMIADAGHDLRTPLTAMRGEIEVTLRSYRSPETYQAVLASQLEEVNHLIGISDSLNMLARLDAGELLPQKREIDLMALATAEVDRIRGRAGNRTVELRGPETLTTWADPSMIPIVLTHLLHNAVTHTPEGSHVEVSVLDGDSSAVLVVKDDGPGIPPEDLPRMFDRFYRADVARGRMGGAGLGLSIAAAIVTAHEGTIEAHRGDTEGLAIRVALPRA